MRGAVRDRAGERVPQARGRSPPLSLLSATCKSPCALAPALLLHAPALLPTNQQTPRGAPSSPHSSTTLLALRQLRSFTTTQSTTILRSLSPHRPHPRPPLSSRQQQAAMHAAPCASCGRSALRAAGPGPSSLRMMVAQQQPRTAAPLRVSTTRPRNAFAASALPTTTGDSEPSGGGAGTPPPSPSAAHSSSEAYDRIVAFVEQAPKPAPVFEVAAALAAEGAAVPSPAAAALLSSSPNGGDMPTYHFSYDEEAEEGEDEAADPQMEQVAAQATRLEPYATTMTALSTLARGLAASSTSSVGSDSDAALPPPPPAAAGTMSTARAVRRRARRAERAARAAKGLHAPVAASLGDLEAMAPWVDPVAAQRLAERAARAAGAAPATTRASSSAAAALGALTASGAPAPARALLARRLEAVIGRLTRDQAAGGLQYREPKGWQLTFDEEAHADADAFLLPVPPPGMRFAMATATASFDEGAGAADSY